VLQLSLCKICIGLLAHTLAISVASGSGLATLSSVTKSAQEFVFNSGVGFYKSQMGSIKKMISLDFLLLLALTDISDFILRK
jgi:hypothetical protein